MVVGILLACGRTIRYQWQVNDLSLFLNNKIKDKDINKKVYTG